MPGTSAVPIQAVATAAFGVSSHYDGAIYNWFTQGQGDLRLSAGPTTVLRYGENPHQQAACDDERDAGWGRLPAQGCVEFRAAKFDGAAVANVVRGAAGWPGPSQGQSRQADHSALPKCPHRAHL